MITAGLADNDPTDLLSITVAGLPAGATLSAGVRNADGSYTLTGDQLAGLTLTPAPDSDDDFTLTVTATAHDSATGIEAYATGQLPVTVIDAVEVDAPTAIPSVTAPSLAVSAAVGAENGTIPLVIDSGLVDAIGNQTLTVTIGGLPEGATLSAGTLNPDGTYTLTGDQLAGLTLTPALDSGEDFTLTVTATAVDSVTGVEANTTTQLPVTVIDAVEVEAPDAISSVTAPSLTVSAAVGAENDTIPLVIDSGLVDVTGNQTLTVTIGGLPEGATLSAGTLNPDGTYTLTGDQLARLTLTPAPDSGEDFTLTVTATAIDSVTGVEANATTQLPITVIDAVEVEAPDTIPSVTAPSLTVSAAVGAENDTIPLVIDSGLVDLTGDQTLTVTIGGLPEGATLSVGTLNPDGTYTLTGDQLAGLILTPAIDSGEDFTLTVTATAVDNITGVEANASTQLPVTVIDAVEVEAPDAIPSVTAPSLAVSAAVGTENGDIPLTITSGLVDATGNQTLTVTIGGLPEGATLSAGTLNPDGTYTLTGDQLAGLTLTPAPDSGEDFTLTVTATAVDNVTGVEANATTQLPITVIDTVEIDAPTAIPSVTAPSLAVSAAVGAENGTIPLVIDSGLVDAIGNQTLTVTIGGLPEGATLSAGTLNPDGTYTLTGDQLAGLTLTPAQNSGEDFTLTVTATAVDNVTGVEANASTQLPVTVIDAVEVDAPTAITSVTSPDLTVAPVAGLEDTPILLDIQPVLDGIEISGELLVAIGDLPAGAVLSAGTAAPDGVWIVSADQLDGLTLTPPPNFSGPLTLSVTPITVGADDVALTGTTVPLVIDVQGVADTPTLSADAVTGLEDTPIPLVLGASLGDLDGSETLTVDIAGLPEGATLSAGTQNAGGTYTLTADQLAGLTLTPPADMNGSFTLTVTATASEAGTDTTASTTLAVPVTVIGVLDAPSLSVVAASGLEDTPISLAITAGLVDVSPTTTLSVTIDGLPEGATLSAGTENADGSWSLTGEELVGLTLTPAPGSSEDFSLNITATAHDSLTGSEVVTTASLPVEVIDVVDAPSLIPEADTTTTLTDAEFLQAVESLEGSTTDTSGADAVLDPVVSMTSTTSETTETTVVEETTVTAEPPPPDSTTTITFNTL